MLLAYFLHEAAVLGHETEVGEAAEEAVQVLGLLARHDVHDVVGVVRDLRQGLNGALRRLEGDRVGRLHGR